MRGAFYAFLFRGFTNLNEITVDLDCGDGKIYVTFEEQIFIGGHGPRKLSARIPDEHIASDFLVISSVIQTKLRNSQESLNKFNTWANAMEKLLRCSDSI